MERFSTVKLTLKCDQCSYVKGCHLYIEGSLTRWFCEDCAPEVLKSFNSGAPKEEPKNTST